MNTLRPLLDDYLTTCRALGFKLRMEGSGLNTFVSYMESAEFDHITNEIALKWAQPPNLVQPIQWARRLGFIRGFARHCSAIDARTQIPPPDLIPYTRVRPQPLRDMVDDSARAAGVAARVGEGDLSYDVAQGGRGDDGLLGSVSAMQDRLRSVVGEIKANAPRVTSVTGELFGSSRELTGGAATQHESSMAIAAAVQELTVSVNHLNDIAHDARTLVIDSVNSAVAGGAIVRQSVADMRSIEAAIV